MTISKMYGTAVEKHYIVLYQAFRRNIIRNSPLG